MKHYKLSVIVNIYNEDTLLKDCVESILHQTYMPFEIILVDDGSSDESSSICLRYAEIYTHIRAITKRNEGLVKSRKVGIKEAQGDYVAFIDGDDTVAPDYFEIMMNEVNKNDVDIVVSGHTEVLEKNQFRVRYNGISPGLFFKNDLSLLVYPYMINMGEEAEFGIFTYLWNKVFRLALLKDEVLLEDERIFIGEDACSVYPALLRASAISIIEYSGYYYRQRIDSMVKTSNNKDVEVTRLCYLAQYLKQRFKQLGYEEILDTQLRSFICNQVCVRTDGINPKLQENDFFPFLVPKHNQITLYGAGTFGQQIFRRLKNKNLIKKLEWVDEHASIYQGLGLPVKEVDKYSILRSDYVLIARIQKSVGDLIEQNLIHQGVAPKKILRARLSDEEKKIICQELKIY